jgi:hypothetical protein
MNSNLAEVGKLTRWAAGLFKIAKLAGCNLNFRTAGWLPGWQGCCRRPVLMHLKAAGRALPGALVMQGGAEA